MDTPGTTALLLENRPAKCHRPCPRRPGSCHPFGSLPLHGGTATVNMQGTRVRTRSASKPTWRPEVNRCRQCRQVTFPEASSTSGGHYRMAAKEKAAITRKEGDIWWEETVGKACRQTKNGTDVSGQPSLNEAGSVVVVFEDGTEWLPPLIPADLMKFAGTAGSVQVLKPKAKQALPAPNDQGEVLEARKVCPDHKGGDKGRQIRSQLRLETEDANSDSWRCHADGGNEHLLHIL